MNEAKQLDEAQIAAYLALAIIAMAILARPLLPTWYDENCTLRGGRFYNVWDATGKDAKRR